MTENPFGVPTPPPSSSPFPELRYDSDGRPVGGSPHAVPPSSYGTSSGYGTPGTAGRRTPFADQYVPGQYSQGTTTPSDPYTSPTAPPAAASYSQAQPTTGFSQHHGQPPGRSDQVLLVLSWGIAAVTSLYMLPWAIAVTRRRHDATLIALVTLLTGWTIIGWIISFIWSLTGSPRRTTPPSGWYPNPTGVGQRFWDGHAWTDHTQP